MRYVYEWYTTLQVLLYIYVIVYDEIVAIMVELQQSAWYCLKKNELIYKLREKDFVENISFYFRCEEISIYSHTGKQL